jgi:hypothetical protein
MQNNGNILLAISYFPCVDYPNLDGVNRATRSSSRKELKMGRNARALSLKLLMVHLRSITSDKRVYKHTGQRRGKCNLYILQLATVCWRF